MTNWADDVIEEEAEEGDEYRSDGDVLGEVTGKTRRKIPNDDSIPYEEQWQTDMDAYQALKVCGYPLVLSRECCLEVPWRCSHATACIMVAERAITRYISRHGDRRSSCAVTC